MIMYSWEIYASLVFVLLAKIISYGVQKRRLSMFNKSGTVLTSIPENGEEEDIKKWVPKKKHEVLKAKYKCLKKLFQIYDASVIGILPETCEPEPGEECESRSHVRRRRRSRRTKTDAGAGTAELTSGDVTDADDTDKASTVATAVIRDLKLPQHSCTSTQFDAATTISNSKLDRYATTENSKTNITEQDFRGSDITQTLEKFPHPMPYLMMNEKPKLTRFQCFIQRIFGIKRERSYKNFVHLNGHVYAASDNNITPHYYEKRRRRGLRFRKLKRPKKIQSESALNVKSPMILTYVQSVQKNCLMDTTPRQCPILGCKMIFYGIINYNDHLNLCHFTDRKYICHYCHEGFESECDKYIHENEHIGISKLSLPNISTKQRVASVTQTDPELVKNDVADDKLKKIVSFFDKLGNPDQIISEIKKNRYSESNLHSVQRSKDDCTTENASENSETDKRTISCVSLHRKKLKNAYPMDSKLTSKASFGNAPVACQLCGEKFDYRRQLSLHVDLEHRVHNKFSKFHSCAGITNPRRCDLVTEDGKIDFKTEDKRLKTDDLRRKSEESLTYDPSTNIVYYTSMESVNSKAPVGYKWEPGTKIIRV